MTPTSTNNLLRRTSLALAALAAAWFAIPASAANITYSSGETCAYNSMTVDPAGNVTVTCAAPATGGQITGGTTPPPPPPPPPPTGTGGDASFTLTGPTTAVAGTTVTLTGTITAASTNKVNWTLAVSGTGCSFPTGFTIAPNTTSATVSGVLASTGPTTCTVTIMDVRSGGVSLITGHTLLPLSIGITSSTTSPPPPPPGGGGVPVVSNCPAADPSTTMYTLPAAGQHFDNTGKGGQNLVLPSGAIASFPLPPTPSGFFGGSAQLTYGTWVPTAWDPAKGIEMSISRCPGVIDTGPNGPTPTALTGAVGTCYYASGNVSVGNDDWLSKVGGSALNKCTALDSDPKGPYYLNIRFNYTGCGNSPACGVQLQWNGAS